MSAQTPFKLNLITLAVLATCSHSVLSFAADDATQTIKMAPIVVTGTRVEQNSFDLPIAIDVVDQEDIQAGQLQMTLSESLIRIPGITAHNQHKIHKFLAADLVHVLALVCVACAFM